MEMNVKPKILDQIRDGLVETRQTISGSLLASSPLRKKEYLGPASEQDLEERLDLIGVTIEKAENGSLGICEVCNDYVNSPQLEMDYTYSVCLDHLSSAEARHLESELELTQSVQRSLMPLAMPDVPGLEMAAFSRPAQIVGGDYFDFFPFLDKAQGLVIADVAGHGISASLHMASLQTLLRTLTPLNTSPDEVIRQIDHLLIHNIHFTTFVTLFLGSYNPQTRSLVYCNAGHNPPLVFRPGAGQPLTWLSPTGAAIGLVEGFHFLAESINLLPGDILLFYTDGVTESMDDFNEEYGSERLAALLQRQAHLPPSELIQSLRYELQAFTNGNPPADDITILVIKVVG